MIKILIQMILIGVPDLTDSSDYQKTLVFNSLVLLEVPVKVLSQKERLLDL